jgi:hypothetical protein
MRMDGKSYPVSGRCPVVSIIPKSFLFILITFLNTAGFGQSSYQALTKIDNIVHQIDSLSIKSQYTFYLNKMDKKFDGVKETWNYTMRDGKVIVFQIRYVQDSTEFIEVYYLNKGFLIYSEEYETLYYSSTGVDEIIWGGIYYFVSNTLKQRVTLGDKKMKDEYWNPETETLMRFHRRFIELQENIPLTAKRY